MSKFIKCKKLIGNLLTAAIIAATIFTFNTGVNAAASINDIGESSDYAKASILALVEKQIINGDENGFFQPMRTVKRSEMSTMLVKALGLTAADLPEEPTFADVPKEHWAYQYVETAYSLGIVQGVSEDTFDVDRECTREEMAAMFVRALGLTEDKIADQQLSIFVNGLNDKQDISDWAKNYVEFVLSTDLMKGVGDNNFDPKGSAQKQQVAVVTDRFITNKASIDNFARAFKGELVHQDLFNALKKNDSEYKGDIDMYLQMDMSDLAELIKVEVIMSAKGKMDTNKSRFDLTYDMSVEVTDSTTTDEGSLIQQQARIIKIGDLYYIYDPSNNAWTTIDSAELGDLSQIEISENSAELVKYFRYANIAKEDNVDFGGISVTKYTLSYSKELMNAMMIDVFEKQGQVQELVSKTDSDIIVYLNDNNQIVYQEYSFSGIMWSESEQENINIDILTHIKYDNIDQDVVIEAPLVQAPEEASINE